MTSIHTLLREHKDIALHFSSDAQSIIKGLQLRPLTQTHIIVGTLETEDDCIRSISKPCRKKQSQELRVAMAESFMAMDENFLPVVTFHNRSLEKMVNANELGSRSVSAIIDLSGLWFTTCQAGNDRMREMLLSFLAPNAVLYTTFAPILNSWMRLITRNGEIHPTQEFIDTNTKFGPAHDCMKIYKIPIRRALEGPLDCPNDESDKEDFLMSILNG